MLFGKAACPAFWSKMTVFDSTLASSMLRRDTDARLSLLSYTWLYASFYAIITKKNQFVLSLTPDGDMQKHIDVPNAPDDFLVTTFSQKNRSSNGRGKVDRRPYCVETHSVLGEMGLTMSTWVEVIHWRESRNGDIVGRAYYQRTKPIVRKIDDPRITFYAIYERPVNVTSTE